MKRVEARKWMRLAACALLAAFGVAGVRAESLKNNEDDNSWTKKVTVSRGEEHTFWVTGLTAGTAVMSIYAEGEYSYKEDGEKYDDSVYASEYAEEFDSDGTLTGLYCLLTAEDWESVPDTVKSVKLTVTVDGFYDDEEKANNQFTFGHASGRANFPGEAKPTIPSGHPDNPLSLSVKETSDPLGGCGVKECSFEADEEYAFDVYTIRAALKKDRRYYFGADMGADGTMACTMTVGGVETNLLLGAKAYEDWSLAATYTFVAPADGTAVITVTGGEDFDFYHAVLPVRKPVAHDFDTLSVGATSAEFTPGRENALESDAWDAVIDERLFHIDNYKKGDTLAFTTEGATKGLIMRLYDSAGKTLAENFRMADGDSNVLLTYTATANYADNSALYVGVCQRLGEDEEPDAGCVVTLSATKVELAGDVTALMATPAAGDGNPLAAAGTTPSAKRTLGAGEWASTFVIAARAGLTYHVKAVNDAPNGNAVTAEVYTVSGTRRTALTEKANGLAGSLDPDADGWLSFTPTAHGNVYIDVKVADRAAEYGSGQGLAFGPYALVATATSESGELGVLTVPMKGASQDLMAWKLLSGPGASKTEPFYAAGTSVLVPAGAYVLVAQTVTGFAKPDAKGYGPVDVSAGTEATVAPVFKYTDSADPLDDSPDAKAKHPTLKKAYAPTKLAPSATKPVTASRSLWKGENGAADDVDWFTFAGADGAYYRFELSQTEGAPKMAVFGPNNWTNECDYVLAKDPLGAVQVCAAKGTYYVRVAQADAENPVDSAYTLTASMATPGVVKLAKTELKVKDSAGYADVSVSRTGKDGRVRVAFRTEGDQSGRDDAYYYPTNGVLEWTANDNKAKTVRVRLVPDAAWHADRTVKVVFSPIPEDDDDFMADGEYVAAFATDAKTGATLDTTAVVVSSAAKTAPGTIQVADCATPKKPTLDVVAGETATIALERVGGADGRIAVTATTAKGTANKTPELDYGEVAETLVWEDGETAAKTLTIQTKSVAGDNTAKKTFTVKFAAKTGKDADGTAFAKPAFASASVTVNIVNEKFVSTMADYAKTLPKAGGVAIKEGKSGTWFVAADGTFFASSPSDLTFTLTGPGRFTYVADGAATNCVVYVPAGSKQVKVAGVSKIDRYDWEALPAAKAAAPTADKAVLKAGTATLAFEKADGISYRVYLLNGATKGGKLGAADTEVAAPYEVELAANAKYTWRVDSFFEGGTVTNVAKAAWSFTTLGEDAPGTPVTGGADAWGVGVAFDETTASATNVELRVGVKTALELADDTATAVKSVSGTLPTGLKIAQDKATKAWSLSGVPTKAGAFEAVVQATYKDGKTTVPGTTTLLAFTVAELGDAAGTFNGLAETADTTNGAPRCASVSVTAAATGKLSAKVKIAGKSIAFTADGYEYAERDEDGTVRVQAKLVNVAKVGSGREAMSVTNVLAYSALVSATNGATAWCDESDVTIEMAALPDAKGSGYQEGVWYDGKVVRDNSKLADWQAEAAAFAGYYTVTLPVYSAVDGAPLGNGYLTLTVDAKGKVKVAGMLADGTKYSGAASAVLSLAEFDGARAMRVPVFADKATTVFGGWLTLCPDADGVVVVVADAFNTMPLWANDDPKSTRDGEEGFALSLHPVGGWYDTVANLQRSYLECDLSVALPEGDEALEEMRDALGLAGGYEFMARPDDTPVTLNGDKMEVEKQKFVTTNKLKDWEASVNASNVKITFNRKTGLVSGTFDVWYEGVNAKGATEQKSVSGLKHNGLLLLSRDAMDGTLDSEVLSSGFFLSPLKVTDESGARPTTRTWNASYQFNVNAVETPRIWTDAPASSAE